MTRVLFAAAEAAPFYKTGGLGDVSMALPRALQAEGIETRVVIPYYPHQMPTEYQQQVSASDAFYCSSG